ncbi:hypothetical protein H5410_004002 [Solanum commersonii]|uniref:Uncharacterized protein n=1 Tax=Solanum commersonii TaxID=4109 RepID=A0A9J6B671_SOLCO|nr:hypothetical protein H5410_004002 [Solanum commersonii]
MVNDVQLRFELVEFDVVTRLPKPDVIQSNVDDGTLLTFVDLKKDLDGFKLHVDKKFGEILQSFVLMGRKKYEHDYSTDGVSANLGTDVAQFSCNVVPDESSKPTILEDDKDIDVPVSVESLKDDIYIVGENFKKLKG